MGRDAKRQQFLDRAFANQEISIVTIAHHHGHATTHEIEWNLVDFPVVLQLVDKFVLQGEFKNRNVE